MFSCTPVYNANYNSTAFVNVNQGGTYSSKTYSIMQVLCCRAVSEAGIRALVVGQDIPNLKVGAMTDMERIIDSSETFRSLITKYNGTDFKYTFNSGSTLQFKSFKDAQDAKSGKREYLFLNEANGQLWTSCDELMFRTERQIFIDYNPTAEFWVHEKLLKTRQYMGKPVQLFISDHRHNTFLTKEQHDSIEARTAEDPEWGKVYGRGLTGKIEGLIFSNWYSCESVPANAKFIGRGLDFGFTNDPTAIIDLWVYDQELYIDQHVYQTGLTNPDIAARIETLPMPRTEVVCDSAEPKSIAELSNMGIFATGVVKGADSVKNSIDILKRFKKINITERSAETRKEFGRYKYKVDRNGVTHNEPVDFMNHAIDAIRYVALMKLGKRGGHFEIR